MLQTPLRISRKHGKKSSNNTKTETAAALPPFLYRQNIPLRTERDASGECSDCPDNPVVMRKDMTRQTYKIMLADMLCTDFTIAYLQRKNYCNIAMLQSDN